MTDQESVEILPFSLSLSLSISRCKKDDVTIGFWVSSFSPDLGNETELTSPTYRYPPNVIFKPDDDV